MNRAATGWNINLGSIVFLWAKEDGTTNSKSSLDKELAEGYRLAFSS